MDPKRKVDQIYNNADFGIISRGSILAILKKALRIFCYAFTLAVFTRVILPASNEAPDWTDLIVHVAGLTAIVTFFLVKEQYSKNNSGPTKE